MNDLAIRYISKYSYEHFDTPNIRDGMVEFQICSYSRWIINELIFKILDNPLITAIDTTYNFILELVYLSVNCDKNKENTVFKVGVSVLEDVLNMLSDSEEKGYI